MLLKRDENIRRRISTFEGNLGRAVSLGNLSAIKWPPAEPPNGLIVSDLQRSAIVFAVGSVDELCKGLFFEVLSGYLLGDLEVPFVPRAPIPVGVARLFIDGQTANPSVKPQFEAIAVVTLQRHIERDNFQSYESIASRFSDCGLGRLKVAFGDDSVRDRFRQSLATLSEIRHSAVHRVGLVDQNSQMTDDSHLVSETMLSFAEHVNNLRVGGVAIAERLMECVDGGR